MTAKHAENVLSAPISEIGNNNKSSSEDFSSFEKSTLSTFPTSLGLRLVRWQSR